MTAKSAIKNQPPAEAVEFAPGGDIVFKAYSDDALRNALRARPQLLPDTQVRGTMLYNLALGRRPHVLDGWLRLLWAATREATGQARHAPNSDVLAFRVAIKVCALFSELLALNDHDVAKLQTDIIFSQDAREIMGRTPALADELARADARHAEDVAGQVAASARAEEAGPATLLQVMRARGINVELLEDDRIGLTGEVQNALRTEIACMAGVWRDRIVALLKSEQETAAPVVMVI